jgi:hypothetical protein
MVAAMCIANAARPGVWGTDPVLGFAADFSTNPGLLDAPHSSETHAALLIDAPTTYVADAMKFSIDPSFRISNSSGYSSLASDYEHLTAAGEIDSERNALVLTGEIARDSSLYYDYAFNGSTGVRRDTTLADLNWTRLLTERTNFNLEVDSNRVLYGDEVGLGINTLTDYRYTAAIPSFSWKEGERTTFTLTGNAGLYDAINGQTKSVNSDLQAGFTRQIAQLWTLTANAGYSRESNTVDEYFGPYLLGTFKSTDTGSIFNVNLTRQGALLAVTASAQRSLVPSGFAFLARQDSYQLSFDYPYSERWTFDGHVRRLTSTEPEVVGPVLNQSYLDAGLSAVWLFTEHWTFTMRASHVTATYGPPTVNVGASGISLLLARKFNHIEWH